MLIHQVLQFVPMVLNGQSSGTAGDNDQLYGRGSSSGRLLNSRVQGYGST